MDKQKDPLFYTSQPQGTGMEDIHLLSPEVLLNFSLSELKGTTLDKKVEVFYLAIKSIRDSWSMTQRWMEKYGYDKICKDNTSEEQLVDVVFATLDSVIKSAAELFDLLEGEALNDDFHRKSGILSLTEFTPSKKLVPPDDRTEHCTEVSSNVSRSLHGTPFPIVKICQNSSSFEPKNETMKKLKPQAEEDTEAEGNIKCAPSTNKNMKLAVSSMKRNDHEKQDYNIAGETGILKSAPPPPTTMGAVLPSKGSIPAPMPLKKCPGPPLPPLPAGPGKILLQRKANTKLKRSIQMPNLFRKLRDMMEGSCFAIKPANVRKVQLGGSTGGKEGLAASLSELTERSPYFQQIEEDIQKYKQPLQELTVAINSFQTNDMVKLLKFRNDFETILGVLTDESQVLAKFEDFPVKKLETLRAAASLYSKLDSIISTLKTWEITPPLVKVLDKVECYFRKVKQELEAFERIKDEESKKFNSYGIDFDFSMVTRLKESIVDLSCGCIELALKARKQAKTAKGYGEIGIEDQKMKENVKLLWRVFQFAFRVYSFAGGQDDYADKLAKELADEILLAN